MPLGPNTKSKLISPRRIRIFVVAVFLLAAAAAFVMPRTAPLASASEPPEVNSEPAPQRRYTEFDHSTKAHQQSCNNCHKFPSPNWKKVRSADTAFPDITDYPRHDSCINCHRQQFFRGRPPAICSICHTNPGPRNSARHPFPNPREIFDKSAKGRTAVSDFGVSFPHEKHIEIVSQNDSRGEAQFVRVSYAAKRQAEASCAVCHQTYLPQGDSDEEFILKPPANLGDAFWLKKGTFKTSPIGHTTCFTCHSVDSGIEPAPSNCAACHKLKEKPPRSDLDPRSPAARGISDKIIMNAWRNRDSSGTFRHEFMAHNDLECATCHNVSKMDTTKAATKRVTLESCAMCHVTSTVDEGGALNFEAEQRKKNPAFQCIKCHISFGKDAIPASHLNALSGQ